MCGATRGLVEVQVAIDRAWSSRERQLPGARSCWSLALIQRQMAHALSEMAELGGRAGLDEHPGEQKHQDAPQRRVWIFPVTLRMVIHGSTRWKNFTAPATERQTAARHMRGRA